MKFPLAVVTMVYNEEFMLPLWLQYYSRQVGANNCYIIDHGSDDLSLDAIGRSCSITRIPRVTHDDGQRVGIVGKFCSALLNLYERVIYVDADEFIVADPKYYSGLLHFCDVRKPGVTTMFGVDVVHNFDEEEAIDPKRKILSQRAWIRPNGFLCKPSLIDREVVWWAGFHGYNGGNIFDNIYLFHLAYVDKDVIWRRQMKRNKSAPTDGGGGHHRYSPTEMLQSVKASYLDLNRVEDADLAQGSKQREDYLLKLFDSNDPRPMSEKHMINHGEDAGLWKLPTRFQTVF